MSFFGFDAALPERKDRPAQSGGFASQQEQRQQPFTGFQATNDDQTFGLSSNAGEEEDLAVYTWGQGGNLLEGNDDLNDETFGDLGDVGNNFQFSSQPAAPAPATKQPKKIASTASRYGPKAVYDPFAASEDDFYSARPSKKSTSKASAAATSAAAKPKAAAPPSSVENLWQSAPQRQPQGPAPGATWGGAGSSVTKPFAPPPGRAASHTAPPPGQIKTLEEIEAEMAGVNIIEPQTRPQVLSLDEIERQMMSGAPEPPHSVTPPSIPTPQPQFQANRGPTPAQPNLPGSGYATGQALLDSMFPELGSASAPAQPPSTYNAAAPNNAPGPMPVPSGPSPEEMARMQQIHERVKGKIQAMSRYNNLMGSSDKDFITRIQLSQLASADPYSSDFYAQVFSALQRSRQVEEGPTVVKVTKGFGFGVGGPAGNRFGKMGAATMQKLSTQVKKLVETRQAAQKSMGSVALQGALGKVTRGNAAAPRPVLAVPTGPRPDSRPVAALNQQSGIRRNPLTKKQVMYALEELYDNVLDLEQTRRDMPPPTAVEELERWNATCEAKVEVIWRRLMVMEPLDISTPHPFISLINPIKGQRLFPRLLRHLPQQQALTLLTLLIATYPQLDVVARAPPPPVADVSLLTKADRLDRAKREAETDNFLHCVIPGADLLINRCNLGLIAGLLGICTQRMEIWRVASTRPGVALVTALLSRAQGLIRSPTPDPLNPQQIQGPDAGELDQWNKTFAYFLSVLLPHLPELFPAAIVHKAAFGAAAYLTNTDDREKEGVEMDRRESEVWGLAAALAVNAPEDQQTNLVAALREKILHTVQSARGAGIAPQRAEIKLRNVNMFLNGLGLDASMIE